jgi:hypothetical protein
MQEINFFTFEGLNKSMQSVDLPFHIFMKLAIF